MIEPEAALATNRSGWNKVAPLFHGGTALPEYGPLAPTEDTLTLLDEVPGSRVLELGCGSGHSLRYLAERVACADCLRRRDSPAVRAQGSAA